MFKKLITLRLVHACVDLLLIYGSFLLAYGVRVGFINSTDFPFSTFASVSILCTLAWSAFLILAKYYRIPPRGGYHVWFDMIFVFLGGIVSIGILVVMYFFPRDIVFSRLIGVLILIFGIVALLLSQYVFRLLLRRAKKQKIGVYRTLIVGANRITEKLIHSINRDRYALFEIVGVIDPYGMTKHVEGAPIFGKLDKLESICQSEKITAIIQCDAFEHTLNLISLCEEKDIKFQFSPSLRGIYEENLRIREIAEQRMISFVKRDFEDHKKQKRYRVIDLILRQVFDVD
ncbi:MAG TPA: hypothetical protein VIT68_01565 [Candidatus Gracilibacteria bacterium]